MVVLRWTNFKDEICTNLRKNDGKYTLIWYSERAHKRTQLTSVAAMAWKSNMHLRICNILEWMTKWNGDRNPAMYESCYEELEYVLVKICSSLMLLLLDSKLVSINYFYLYLPLRISRKCYLVLTYSFKTNFMLAHLLKKLLYCWR